MRVRSIAIAAACIGAALALAILTPDEELIQAPFARGIPATGVPVETRQLVVTVTDARLADRLQTPEWTGTTDGVWLVVGIEFARRSDIGGITASFRIGGTDYALSERPGVASIDNGAHGQPGLPWAGSMVVELPLSALEDPQARQAVMRFSAYDDPILEGVLDYTLDLTALDHERSITLQDPVRVAP
jgi:hypothetical protein